MTSLKNIAASVHARLGNRARSSNRPFQEVLQYYAMERFLYRLSRSPHATRFTLKGALMLHVWQAPLTRASKDIDLLGRTNNAPDHLALVVQELCATEVEPDGMVFDPKTVTATRIKADAEYTGVRVLFVAFLGKAKIRMQIDVGFGDVVTPEAKTIAYPTLLDLPQPLLTGYPRETVVAEKFQAMVYLGTLNTRMKDFFDIWLLARQFDFDGRTLAQALTATFSNRGTVIDTSPVALTAAFTESDATKKLWTSFRRKAQLGHAPATLTEAATVISPFLIPIAQRATTGSRTPLHWRAPGPWSE